MREIKNLRNMLRAAADLVLPRTCLVCGRSLNHSESHICLECLCDLPYTRFWQLERNPMADRYNERIGANIPDGVEEAYGHALALLYYEPGSPYSHIPRALKYDGNLRAGSWFAAMLGSRVAGCPWMSDADLVVPVPLHWRRKWTRGFNQAAVIASEVARALDVPCALHLLRRKRYTKSQTAVGHSERASNVRGAFKVAGVVPPGTRHILLVDDTFTTGSTLADCHRALRQVVPPSVRISVATLSYAGQ